MDKPVNHNPKPPTVKWELQNKYGFPREATVNLYSGQFIAVMRDTTDRLNYQYGGFHWELEYGETPVNPMEITLFVNLWVEGKPILPLRQTFMIEDEQEPLKEAWRTMLRAFTKLVNDGRVLQKLTSRLVEFKAESKKNVTTARPVQKLEDHRSQGIHPSGDRIRKDKNSGTSD